jgi:hypothetical protein
MHASFRLTFLEVGFPAVPATKPSVKKAVALRAGNFEANETEAFSRENRLLTFATGDGCSEFHTSPPQLCLLFLIRQLVS